VLGSPSTAVSATIVRDVSYDLRFVSATTKLTSLADML
jgi:hypothetical protein